MSLAVKPRMIQTSGLDKINSSQTAPSHDVIHSQRLATQYFLVQKTMNSQKILPSAGLDMWVGLFWPRSLMFDTPTLISVSPTLSYK